MKSIGLKLTKIEQIKIARFFFPSLYGQADISFEKSIFGKFLIGLWGLDEIGDFANIMSSLNMYIINQYCMVCVLELLMSLIRCGIVKVPKWVISQKLGRLPPPSGGEEEGDEYVLRRLVTPNGFGGF